MSFTERSNVTVLCPLFGVSFIWSILLERFCSLIYSSLMHEQGVHSHLLNYPRLFIILLCVHM